MAAPPLLRPVGLIASLVGIIQSLLWSVGSLLAILANNCVFTAPFNGVGFSRFLTLYVQGYTNSCINELFNITISGGSDTMTSPEFLAWSCVSLVVNIAWIVTCTLLFIDLYKNQMKKTLNFLYAWCITTCVILVFDLAATIRFAVDYNAMNSLTVSGMVVDQSLQYASPPAVLMTLAARGFVLYVFNVATLVYLTMVIRQMRKTNNEERSRLRQNSTGSFFGNNYVYENNSVYNGYEASQPPWTIQSPMVGSSPRSPWEFPLKKPPPPATPKPASPVREAYSPRTHQIVPRVPVPVSAPVLPRDIPEPDYSPPMPRKYEPKFNEQPQKSALKKKSSMGRTLM